MNTSFLELSIEKQNRIIDSAYKVFAAYEYKKAPMSAIAEVGGISKALLFYYFKNKQELYFYLWDLAVRKIKEESTKQKVLETTDFFEMIQRSLMAKCNIFRAHPYLYLFSTKAYYEQQPEIKEMIHESFDKLSEKSEQKILEHMDTSAFRPEVDLNLLYQEILWVSDGYLHQMVISGRMDADQMKQDFSKMIKEWKKVYLL